MGWYKEQHLTFLNHLRTRPALASFAPALSPRHFTVRFCLLLAARQCWLGRGGYPDAPLEVEELCELARTIDRFMKYDRLNWGGDPTVLVVSWLMRYALETRTGENWEDGNLLPDDGTFFADKLAQSVLTMF